MEYSSKEDFKKQVLQALKNEDTDFEFYIIPEEYTIKLTSYASMKNDLFFLIDATRRIIETHQRYPRPEGNPELTVEAALWYSIIVTYAKLYTDAFDKRSKLEERSVFESLDSKTNAFYKTHKSLINNRHNFVAHRGNSELDNYLVLLKIPKTGDLSNGSFEIKTARAYASGTEYFVECLHLFQKIFLIVDEKMLIQTKRLLKMIEGKPLSFVDPYKI